MVFLRRRRARARGPRLLKGPTLLGATRRDIAELIGWAWLGVEIVRLVRSRLEPPAPVSPRWDHVDPYVRPQDRRR